MTEDKIIELAAQFNDDAPDFVTSTEAVIDFAQAVIKEERKRVNQIIDEVYRQGDHLRWLDCAIAIADRIEEKAE
jgi:hypothetical protein